MDWSELVKIAIAFALAFPVGWERERYDQSAGIRTFPLVAVASCGYVLAVSTLGGESLARAAVGVMTGIGFLGAGAIIRVESTVIHGTATAASIWNMGAVGVAVASGHYPLAIALTVTNYLTLKVLASYAKKKTDA
jgi:putative Mg2+ transporter-C (MgtC) family protein